MSECKHEWEYWEYAQQYLCKKCSTTVQVRDFAEVISKQIYLLQTQVENLNKAWDAVAVSHASLSHLQDVLEERDSLAFKLVIAERAIEATRQKTLLLATALKKIEIEVAGEGIRNSYVLYLAKKALAELGGVENARI